MQLSSGGWIGRAICVYARVAYMSGVRGGYKRMNAGSVLEGWGLWLRSGSAGALLYKTVAYRRPHVSDGVTVRSAFYISCLAMCTLVKGLHNTKLKIHFSFRV